ncbi:hypothetical protein R4282_15505 [Rhodococcus oxybenzonivorans]|uniref:hypothetical protein n=1 Tax=Rhodococcus TaxID=1827 RepID=UPI00135B33A4|nr:MULTISPECIES: hypothetical protein [Rhodococcus]MDV7354410.1 hypothetical protein [Rhodococcus oxybenzonivorans]
MTSRVKHPVRRLLFIGNPTQFIEVIHWAAMRVWATGHGLETTRTFAGGPVVCAVATEDVLDGLCLPSEATMLQRVRREGIPCISVHDAPERIIDEIGALTPLTVLHTEADAESLIESDKASA